MDDVDGDGGGRQRDTVVVVVSVGYCFGSGITTRFNSVWLWFKFGFWFTQFLYGSDQICTPCQLGQTKSTQSTPGQCGSNQFRLVRFTLVMVRVSRHGQFRQLCSVNSGQPWSTSQLGSTAVNARSTQRTRNTIDAR
ncbi:hypothetical protein HanPSC8_Chr15g0675541 [Helianthus annuus]|nr:hypothetical protein HanPSC8_Chr15g0675541 [Helianthus annuus]